MKTTVVFPDALMEEVKLEAARRHKKLKELVPELVQGGLDAQRQSRRGRAPMTPQEAAAWVANLKAIGREIEAHSQDSRTLVQILNDDRR
jgi:hypothetical protein